MLPSYLKRKERIIINAIDILDAGGINGLTMKEIARQQGVTEPAVYRHFQSKHKIVLTILERFAAFDETLMNTIRERKLPPDEAISYFIEAYVTYYANYPQLITVLFSFDVYRYDEEANKLMTMIMEERHRFIVSLVEQGVEQRVFNHNEPPEDYAEMLLGQLWSAMYRWKIGGCMSDLKERMKRRTDWMLCHMKSLV